MGLRGHPLVNQATRERIEKKAAELGYSLNPIASAFLQQVRSGKSVPPRANIALLMEPYGRSIPLKALNQGMFDRAQQLGYTLDNLNIEEHNDASLTRVLSARGVLGVIIGPMLGKRDCFSLDWSKFAAIAFGYSMVKPELHRVVPNHAQILRTAFEKCRARGFRRVGLALTEESDARSNRLWSSCFLGLQRQLSEKEQVHPFLFPANRYTASNLARWLRREKPDAVIFHYQRLIRDHAEALTGRFSDLFCAVLDRLPKDTVPGIDQRFNSCGAQLTDLLSLQILHNERGVPEQPTTTMVNGIWVDNPVPR